MKHAFWGYFVVICGIVIVVILLLVQRMTTTTEEDFYLAREVLESSMIDAVDYGTYRTTGRLVMSEQKFVEVFIRRFAESVTNNKTYELDFYGIYEEPPKASVKVRTSSGNTANIKDTVFDVNLDTLVSGILETIYSQADGDDGTGGNTGGGTGGNTGGGTGGGGDTITVACPEGGTTTIHYTPNNPEGGEDPDPDDDDYDPKDLLTSGVLNFYSVGYLSDYGKEGSAWNGKTCNLLTRTGGMNYTMTFDSLPNGLGEDIAGGRIKKCEVISGSQRVFSSASDITAYKKWKNEYGQHLVVDHGGSVYDITNYDFKYYATSSEISGISVSCQPTVSYDSNGNASGNILINLSYSSRGINRSSANGNVVETGIAENGATAHCLMYTGVKWNLKFYYTKK